MIRKPRWLKRKSLLKLFGYDMSRWSRVVYYRECFAFLRSIRPETLDAMEISGGDVWSSQIPFKSFTEVHYPAYDVCAEPLERSFDVIIADQVWPHLLRPLRATGNVLRMLNDGGWFVVTVPFLIHTNQPVDCTRWTERGLRYLLIEAGFKDEDIRTGSWGNKSAVKASLNRIGCKRGWFGSLENDPRYPMSVWAIARKPA